MSPNLAAVVRQSAFANRIVAEVGQKSRLRRELTKRACINCKFFTGNQYPICPFHPGGLRFTMWEVNDCKDWELISRDIA